MAYECFSCDRSFRAQYSLEQHLGDFHDWPSITDDLNARLQNCPYCDEIYEDYDYYLEHVLSSCSEMQDTDLYWDRHFEVLDVILEAVNLCFPKNGWKIVSGMYSGYKYMLPLRIQNAPGSWSPDILIYSRSRMEAIIIELNVTWETNMAQANLDTVARMDYWSQQFEDRDYDCDCYSVEVGVRGLVSNSFHKCFDDLDLDEDKISEYAKRCSAAALKYSQKILRGEGSNED